MRKHSIWNEALRPDTLDGFVCTDENKIKFQEFIDKQTIPHLLFAGRAGSGKTTLAKILTNNIDCDCLFLNAADERSMDVMRDKVGAFASASSFKPLKIVVLDESTNLLQSAQVMLLSMMETYSNKTRFILTGNYPEKLIDPLRSRCTEFPLTPPTKKQIAIHVCGFLDEMEVGYELDDVAFIINKFYPDQRRIINNLQKYTINNVLEISKHKNQIIGDADWMESLVVLLNDKKTKPSQIRQLITDADVKMFEEVYKYLYDNSSKFTEKHEGYIICLIEEYLYKSTFLLDKEINFMAFIIKLLEILN